MSAVTTIILHWWRHCGSMDVQTSTWIRSIGLTARLLALTITPECSTVAHMYFYTHYSL